MSEVHVDIRAPIVKRALPRCRLVFFAVRAQIKTMAKSSTKTSARSYQSVGTTSDGVRVLKPKTKPTHFTSSEIRSTIQKVLRDNDAAQQADRKKGNVYVEPRASGEFSVKRQHAKRASAVLSTQKDAIERAHEIAPDKAPVVKRVRNTSGGSKGQWRKA